jgi:hypothetical protein
MKNFGKNLVSVVLVFAMVISLIGTVSANTQSNHLEIGGSLVTVSGNGNNLQFMVDGVIVPKSGNGTFVQEVVTFDGSVYEVQVRGNSIVGATQIFAPPCPNELLDALEVFVALDGAGLVITNSDGFIYLAGVEAYEAILEWFAFINELVAEGELAITENFTIYDPNDDSMFIQGGNVDNVELKLWGVIRYASRNSARTIVTTLRNQGEFHRSAALIASALSLKTKGGSIPVAIVFALGAWRVNSMANDITLVNERQTRGVVIEITWITTYKVYAQ